MDSRAGRLPARRRSAALGVRVPLLPQGDDPGSGSSTEKQAQEGGATLPGAGKRPADKPAQGQMVAEPAPDTTILPTSVQAFAASGGIAPSGTGQHDELPDAEKHLRRDLYSDAVVFHAGTEERLCAEEEF